MSSTIDILFTLTFCSLLLFAVVKDVRLRLIPNNICLAIVALGAIASVLTAGVTGLLTSALGIVIGLCILLPVYAFGGIGAGDVKLLAACGAYLGPVGLINGTVLAFLIGGLLGFYYIVVGKLMYLVPRLYAFFPNGGALDRKVELPYGVAIAGGSILALWLAPLRFTMLGLE